MSRIVGICIIGFWAVAFTMLLMRDVAPYWQANDPPKGPVAEARRQSAILDARDRRIGTNWVDIRKQGELTTVQSITVLSPRMLDIELLKASPSVILDTSLTFRPDGVLMTFESRIEGWTERIELTGDLLGIDYSCVARIGPVERQFSLDARFSKELGETLRPFTHLGGLHVGQKWQMHMVDPLSLLTGQTAEFSKIIVEVTGVDRIEHGGRTLECFRVESHSANAIAWVDREGNVLRQTVHVPLLGKFTILDEPYRESDRREARESIQRYGRPRQQSTAR